MAFLKGFFVTDLKSGTVGASGSLPFTVNLISLFVVTRCGFVTRPNVFSIRKNVISYISVCPT